MIRVIILFLIRRRLGLKKFENFQFDNQKSTTDYYYFSENCIWKVSIDDSGDRGIKRSDVSLNWLLDDRCQIIKKGD